MSETEALMMVAEILDGMADREDVLSFESNEAAHVGHHRTLENGFRVAAERLRSMADARHL
jgi:hypothetical protein